MKRPIVRAPKVRALDNFDSAKMTEAYDRFLNGDEDLEALSMALEIPHKMLLRQAHKNKWMDRKEEMVRTIELGHEHKYREFLAKNRKPTAERHLEGATLMEDGVINDLKELEEDLGEYSLKDRTIIRRRLAETLASSAIVSARAAGISDRPAAVGGGIEGERGKSPLIILGVTPVHAPPVVETVGTVIDVEEFVHEQ